MKLDDVTKKIVEDLQKDIKEKKGEDIGIMEIANILSFPFDVASIAMSKKLDIEIPVFGKICYVPKVEIGTEFKRIRDNYEKGSKAFKEETLKVQMAFKAKAKARVLSKNLTLKEFKEAEAHYNVISKLNKL